MEQPMYPRYIMTLVFISSLNPHWLDDSLTQVVLDSPWDMPSNLQDCYLIILTYLQDCYLMILIFPPGLLSHDSYLPQGLLS